MVLIARFRGFAAGGEAGSKIVGVDMDRSGLLSLVPPRL
jgi:hypothetical protein